jgi:hypothetical protein
MTRHYRDQLRIRGQVISAIQTVVSNTIHFQNTLDQYLEDIKYNTELQGISRLTTPNRQYCLGYEGAISPVHRIHTLFEFKYQLDGVWQTTDAWSGETHKRVANDKQIPRGFFWKGTDNVWFISDSKGEFK